MIETEIDDSFEYVDIFPSATAEETSPEELEMTTSIDFPQNDENLYEDFHNLSVSTESPSYDSSNGDSMITIEASSLMSISEAIEVSSHDRVVGLTAPSNANLYDEQPLFNLGISDADAPPLPLTFLQENFSGPNESPEHYRFEQTSESLLVYLSVVDSENARLVSEYHLDESEAIKNSISSSCNIDNETEANCVAIAPDSVIEALSGFPGSGSIDSNSAVNITENLVNNFTALHSVAYQPEHYHVSHDLTTDSLEILGASTSAAPLPSFIPDTHDNGLSIVNMVGVSNLKHEAATPDQSNSVRPSVDGSIPEIVPELAYEAEFSEIQSGERFKCSVENAVDVCFDENCNEVLSALCPEHTLNTITNLEPVLKTLPELSSTNPIMEKPISTSSAPGLNLLSKSASLKGNLKGLQFPVTASSSDNNLVSVSRSSSNVKAPKEGYYYYFADGAPVLENSIKKSNSKAPRSLSRTGSERQRNHNSNVDDVMRSSSSAKATLNHKTPLAASSPSRKEPSRVSSKAASRSQTPALEKSSSPAGPSRTSSTHVDEERVWNYGGKNVFIRPDGDVLSTPKMRLATARLKHDSGSVHPEDNNQQ